jgi:hypothetical protein
MSIIINPGSGPVDGATYENAAANMDAFVADLHGIWTWRRAVKGPDDDFDWDDDDDGRWPFIVTHVASGIQRVIEMPGLPLEQVRWMDEPDQDIWDFPRLYVDGSSWVWKFARDSCSRSGE